MKHSSIIGGSTAQRRIECPGSYRAELDKPDQSSRYADEGTMLHAVMEQCLRDGLPPFEPKDFLGYRHPNGVTFEREHLHLVDTALNAFTDLASMFLGVRFEQEVQVEVPQVPGGFGTCDVLGVGSYEGAKTLLVADWKFGKGVVVPARANYQLAFYATGALAKEADVEQVMLAIIQPTQEDPLDTWIATREWMSLYASILERIPERAQQPNAPLKVGSWCRWCKAAAGCPAKLKMVGDALSKQPESMTAIELAAALDMAEKLEPWIATVRNLAHRELDNGASVPGFELQAKRAYRSFIDENVAASFLLEHLESHEVLTSKVVSPAQAEKALRAAGKKDAVLRLQDLVTAQSSGTVVKRISEAQKVRANAAPVTPLGRLGAALRGKV